MCIDIYVYMYIIHAYYIYRLTVYAKISRTTTSGGAFTHTQKCKTHVQPGLIQGGEDP